jgi:hypothetical protein
MHIVGGRCWRGGLVLETSVICVGGGVAGSRGGKTGQAHRADPFNTSYFAG